MCSAYNLRLLSTSNGMHFLDIALVFVACIGLGDLSWKECRTEPSKMNELVGKVTLISRGGYCAVRECPEFSVRKHYSEWVFSELSIVNQTGTVEMCLYAYLIICRVAKTVGDNIC